MKAAKVTSLTGKAYIERGGQSIALEQGAELAQSDVVRTAEDSKIELRFADDSIIELGPETQVAIRDFAFDPSGQAEPSFALHMMGGVVRSISGKIVEQNPESFKLTSPLGAVGIRGTETLHVIAQGSEIHSIINMNAGHTVVISTPDGRSIVLTQALKGVALTGGSEAPLMERDVTPDWVNEFLQKATGEAITHGGEAPRGFYVVADAATLSSMDVPTVADGIAFVAEENTDTLISALQEAGVDGETLNEALSVIMPEFFTGSGLFGEASLLAQAPSLPGGEQNTPANPNQGETGSGTNPNPGGSDPNPNPGGNPDPNPGGNPDPNPNPGGNPDPNPNPGGNPDPNPNPGGDPDPNPGGDPDPKPNPGGDPDPKPGGDPDPNPGGDPDPVPGGDPDPKPGGDPDPVPGGDPDPVPGIPGQERVYNGGWNSGNIYGDQQEMNGGTGANDTIRITDTGGAGNMSGGSIYGDAQNMNSSAAGGSDSIMIAGVLSSGSIYGDTGEMNGGSGGADTISIGGNISAGANIYGDARSMNSSASAGNDSIIINADGRGSEEGSVGMNGGNIYGDAYVLNSKISAGNDTIKVNGDMRGGYIFGDAETIQGQSGAGNDSILVTGEMSGGIIYGDAKIIQGKSSAGADNITVGGMSGNAVIYGDAQQSYTDINGLGGNTITVSGAMSSGSIYATTANQAGGAANTININSFEGGNIYLADKTTLNLENLDGADGHIYFNSAAGSSETVNIGALNDDSTLSISGFSQGDVLHFGNEYSDYFNGMEGQVINMTPGNMQISIGSADSSLTLLFDSAASAIVGTDGAGGYTLTLTAG